MSVASAERRVSLCELALRAAYEALRVEREKAAKQAADVASDKLKSVNSKLEEFCSEYLSCNADEHGIGKLPVRLRFVMCARASGLSGADIAAALPKINGHGQFVRMGISVGGLSKLIREAQSALRESA